jgi:hypothetical protein
MTIGLTTACWKGCKAAALERGGMMRCKEFRGQVFDLEWVKGAGADDLDFAF